MNRDRKKIAVILIAIAISSGKYMTLSAQTITESETSQSEADSVLTNDPNFAIQTVNSPPNRELFIRLTLSVLLIAALGIAAIYLSKRLLPKITNLSGKEIRVLETTYLGPRKAVHLIEIGSQRLLIGSTNENITTLAHITNTAMEFSMHEPNENMQV